MTIMRRARREDVEDIVAMLADDPLGAGRERPGDPRYALAFEDLDADPRQLLAVAELGGEVVGTLQLTFIPGLSRVGSTRALIEAVRVRADQRGAGLGQRMIEWATAGQTRHVPPSRSCDPSSRRCVPPSRSQVPHSHRDRLTTPTTVETRVSHGPGAA